MYTLKTVEEIVETFVKEDAPQWVKDYVWSFVKNYYFVGEETAVKMINKCVTEWRYRND